MFEKYSSDSMNKHNINFLAKSVDKSEGHVTIALANDKLCLYKKASIYQNGFLKVKLHR